MVINYAIWSGIISLTAIIFFYPLKSIAKGWVSQVYASLLLLPALISSFYLSKLIYRNQIILTNVSQIPMTKLFFGAHIDHLNSIILFSLNLTFLMFIFLLPRKKIVENISFLSLSFLILSLITLMPDHLMRVFVFGFGITLINYAIINSENNESELRYLTKSFMINITSDFLLFIALLYVLLNENTLLSYKLVVASAPQEIFVRLLCFAALALRLISLIAIERPVGISVNITIKNSILKNIIIGVGSSILLLKIAPIVFIKDKLDLIFIFSAAAIIVCCLISLILDRQKNSFHWFFSTLVSSSTFFIICLGYNFIAAVMICISLFIFPLITLPATLRMVLIHADRSREIPLSNPLTTFLDIVFFKFAKKIISFFTNLFTNFLNPLYAGFILFRIPQICVGIIQMPLRFLNNGNIERSMIFVLFIVAIYIYWWGGGRV